MEAASIKPPFAGYDLVVYFGIGLFLVPFVDFYILKPFGITYPEVNDTFSEATSVEYLVAALSLAFIIYVIGHATAYLSGQFVQKPIEAIFGKASHIVYHTARMKDANRDQQIRALIRSNLQGQRQSNAVAADIFRGLSHLPLLPAYLVAYRIGVFGYYHSRIPGPFFAQLEQKLTRWDLPDQTLGGFDDRHSRWFAPIRFFVINHCLVANSRMHNFFTILGLFRSLAFIFLTSLWLEIFYLGYHLFSDKYPLGAGGTFGIFDFAWRYMFFALSAGVCILAFMRFQRRYVEEALYAFALAKVSETPSIVPTEEPARG